MLDVSADGNDLTGVIRGYCNKALRAYFDRQDGRGLSVRNVARVSRILRALDVATRPE
jgi:hypothetical protein